MNMNFFLRFNNFNISIFIVYLYAWIYYLTNFIVNHLGFLKLSPANTALSPNSSSILSSWLYLAVLSDLQGAPVLICPVPNPTTRSAMNVSSVSPDLWLTITPMPFFYDNRHASIASERDPIWLTLSRRAVQAFISIAF